jgi:hypothetical protein
VGIRTCMSLIIKHMQFLKSGKNAIYRVISNLAGGGCKSGLGQADIEQGQPVLKGLQGEAAED